MVTDWTKKHGRLLRHMRRSRGFETQAQLADSVEVSVEAVGAWEQGKHRPSGVKLTRLAEALRVPEHIILSGLSAVERYEDMPPSEIPIIGRVAAGDPDQPLLRITPLEHRAILPSPGTFALEVVGDSMAPIALDGQAVICDHEPPLQGDLVVCFIKRRGGIFRRWGLLIGATLTLEAANVAQGESLALPVSEVESIHRVTGVRFIVD